MTAGHGVRALTVAAATAVAGDHSIASAVIVAAGGLLTVVAGQVTAALLRRVRKPPVDHHEEVIAEQKELAEHLIAELVEQRSENRDKDDQIRRQQAELRRLRRRDDR